MHLAIRFLTSFHNIVKTASLTMILAVEFPDPKNKDVRNFVSSKASKECKASFVLILIELVQEGGSY